jgi:formiminotetrahydrofolate cyclodeaminase
MNRRKNPGDDVDETQLVADSIRTYNSRYTKEDSAKFEEIMAKHGFPKAGEEDKSLHEAFANAGASDAKKAYELHMMQNVRHGVMVLGKDIAACNALVEATAKATDVDVVRVEFTEGREIYGY